MRNIKLILEYEGTNYHGWQSQAGSGRVTIQETLENAIRAVGGGSVTTYSSGRTDAGVHAWGHVVNFHTESTIPAAAWAPALNHALPMDIRVLAADEVSDDFHARYSAVSKIYKYIILNRPSPSALYRNFAWHIGKRVNLDHVQDAAACLVGTHDFSAFRSSGCGATSPTRTVIGLEIKRVGDFVEFSIEANAFLQYMVRNITGTLAEVGLGRFQSNDVKDILASRDRTRAGRTAPAKGLYLVRVMYRV